MTNDKKPLPFKYDWLKLVQGLDHKKFGNFKTIAYWIADHMFGDNPICNPGIDFLAKESGMPRRTAIEAINAGVEAGWIDKRKGGGTTANGAGISTAYCILIPCGLWHCTDTATVQKFHTYSAELAGQQCKKTWATVRPAALESSLESFLESKKETRDGTKEMDEKKERDQIQSPSIDPSIAISDEKAEANHEGHQSAARDSARASLPVATIDQRAVWGDAWPRTDRMIKPYEGTISLARHFVTYDCLDVMGYQWRGEDQSDIRMPDGSAHKYRDAWLKSLLPPDVIDEFAARKLAGTLSETDIANVLASLDIAPKAQKKQEAIRDAQF